MLVKGDPIKVVPTNDMRQTFNYDCGAKALQTVLAYWGTDVREDELIEELGTDPENGTNHLAIEELAREYGYEVWAGSLEMEDLREMVQEEPKIPVLTIMQAWAKTDMSIEEWAEDVDDGHYVVVIGMDHGKVIIEDPASTNRVWVEEDEFDARWHDMDPETGDMLIHYAIVIVPDDLENEGPREAEEME